MNSDKLPLPGGTEILNTDVCETAVMAQHQSPYHLNHSFCSVTGL
jgi:hypothetical protein